MCLSESYHGETIGALSVGSMDLYARIYKPMMMNNIHFDGLDCYRCPYGQTRDTCNCECFVGAEKAFVAYGKETAALIVEPILQAQRVCASTRRNTCAACAISVTNMASCSSTMKSLPASAGQARCSPSNTPASAGYPLHVERTDRRLPAHVPDDYDRCHLPGFYDDFKTHKAFVHSHTYAGNPLACRAALAVLHIMERDDILKKAAEKSIYLHEKLDAALGSHSHVGEIRHIG